MASSTRWTWSQANGQHFCYQPNGSVLWENDYRRDLENGQTSTSPDISNSQYSRSSHGLYETPATQSTEYLSAGTYSSVRSTYPGTEYYSTSFTPSSQNTAHYPPVARAPIRRADSAPAAQTTKTYQPRETAEMFQWTVEIPFVDSMGRKKVANALALLDTQAQKGNWISRELLERLNKMSEVERLRNPPILTSAAGPVTAAGQIDIEVKRREGNRYYACHCYVFPPSTGVGFDLIFGRDFINENRLLTVNNDALLPLLEDDRLTPAEQAAIAAAQAERLRQQAAIQARRAAGN